MKKTRIGVISLFVVILLIAFTGMVYADTGVPAVPEVQGLTTSTGMNAQGTVTETDAGAWTATNDPSVNMYQYNSLKGQGGLELSIDELNAMQAQLQGSGGSITWIPGVPGMGVPIQYIIPESLLNEPLPSIVGFPNWGSFLAFLTSHGYFSPPTVTATGGGLHTGVLDPGQVQYTAGYNDQYAGISGQQTFVKSMALSTANTIADQSNIKANTNIQFIAVDTGRATRTEDLLLDGASQAQNSANLILCPFANANPGIIPAFCNIEQAGSAFDATLTSTVTSADTRFVGTDATIPVVLNYNINSQGITLGNQSSPMIGSVSAYLKVHVQEARNERIVSGTVTENFLFGQGPESFYSFPVPLDPQKSEDLTYSETSTASGLIGKFSKSMSYTSQASAVQAPIPVFPPITPV